MNWQDIYLSPDNTHFLFDDKPVFSKKFSEALKFHMPGLAPVSDESGSYHINSSGIPLYGERYSRTFGYYCNRAAVVQNEKWFHINESGAQVYKETFHWVGNYQENFCSVRNDNNHYFHIDLVGQKIYSETYSYVGDFKDGIACVKFANGFYKHIDTKGNYLNNIDFLDLGIFHKNFATAKDKEGWHHIDKQGQALYETRYTAIEPFYNGFALVTQFNNQKVIINEKGELILKV